MIWLLACTSAATDSSAAVLHPTDTGWWSVGDYDTSGDSSGGTGGDPGHLKYILLVTDRLQAVLGK